MNPEVTSEPMDFEQRVAFLARKMFEEQRCPSFLTLWGKPLGCGQGLGHGGKHIYNLPVGV